MGGMSSSVSIRGWGVIGRGQQEVRRGREEEGVATGSSAMVSVVHFYTAKHNSNSRDCHSPRLSFLPQKNGHLIFAKHVSMANLVEEGVGYLACCSSHTHLQWGGLIVGGKKWLIYSSLDQTVILGSTSRHTITCSVHHASYQACT